jgi:hypothetical protein
MTAPVFTVSSPDAKAEKAHHKASPIWAGYSFGKNEGERKFAMMTSGNQASVPSGMRVHHES